MKQFDALSAQTIDSSFVVTRNASSSKPPNPITAPPSASSSRSNPRSTRMTQKRFSLKILFVASLNYRLFLAVGNILNKISTKDLPMVCFVVTQHTESELSLCLRYSKTSCRRQLKKSVFRNCQLSTVTLGIDHIVLYDI